MGSTDDDDDDDVDEGHDLNDHMQQLRGTLTSTQCCHDNNRLRMFRTGPRNFHKHHVGELRSITMKATGRKKLHALPLRRFFALRRFFPLRRFSPLLSMLGKIRAFIKAFVITAIH